MNGPAQGGDGLAVGQRDDGLRRRARAVRGGALPRRRPRRRALDPGPAPGAAAGARRAGSTPWSCGPASSWTTCRWWSAAGARRAAPLAVVMPTFTYTAYANERMIDRFDFHADGVREQPVAPGEHDRLLARHPEWGRSLYDLHSDGSPVLTAGLRRPVPNLRPDYRSWLQDAPRHLRRGPLPDRLARRPGPRRTTSSRTTASMPAGRRRSTATTCSSPAATRSTRARRCSTRTRRSSRAAGACSTWAATASTG